MVWRSPARSMRPTRNFHVSTSVFACSLMPSAMPTTLQSLHRRYALLASGDADAGQDMTIKNVPAIAMEETTPLGVSNAQRQTPAEVYSAPKSLKVSPASCPILQRHSRTFLRVQLSSLARIATRLTRPVSTAGIWSSRRRPPSSAQWRP
jgi:hypothetical protein